MCSMCAFGAAWHLQTVRLLSSTGAAAVTVHGRTMEQRYKAAADWGLIAATAQGAGVPLIGNGDVLTYYEVGSSKVLAGERTPV
jgi:tRNA-dihydrouridine synthase